MIVIIKSFVSKLKSRALLTGTFCLQINGELVKYGLFPSELRESSTVHLVAMCCTFNSKLDLK